VDVGVRGGLLVGRDEEVARLAALVRAVAGGRGGEVWVEGEPGIGKSALLAAGLAEAQELGCQVFWAAADELGQRFPLRVVLDCLQVVPGASDPARREILELPRAAGAGAASADPVPAVMDRLLALVDRLCAAAPVLLVVDDLQWADGDSLAVWRQLSRVVPQLPLLLVAACRPVPRRTEVVQLQRSAADSGAAMVALEALPPEPVAELVGGLLGVEVVGPGLRRTVQGAAGNPLYVREMVDALAREGRLRRDGGTAELVAGEPGAGVPVSLAAVISDRLGFVSDQTLGVLRAAALLGADFSVGDLAVVAGRPVPELSGVVGEAVAAGVLGESGARLAFRHALIRQVLHDGTPAALRLALRGHAARALADAGAAVERVAEQLLAALPGTDAARAVEGWVLDWLAGPGRVLSYRSPLVAAELLSRAVDHAPPEDPRREELQAVLAPVLRMLGRREEAVELAERVRAVTRDPARAAEISYTLADALQDLLRHEQARAVLTDALRDPGAAGIWTVRMRALLSSVTAASGDYDQVTAAREALAEAERAGDRFAAARASDALFVSLFFQGDMNGSLAVAERSLATLGDDPQTADLRLRMLQARMVVLETLDRLAEAEVAIRELVSAAERFGAPHRLAVNRGGVAEHYYLVGRWDDALAELEILTDDTIPVAPAWLLLLHGVWALIAAHRDDEATADAHLASVADQPVPAGLAADMATQYLVMARAVRVERRGDPEQALGILAGMLDPAHLAAPTDRRLWLPDLVRLALAAGARDTARAAAAASAADAATEPIPSRTAAAGHCAGLIEGDPAPLLAAADTYRTVGRPFELAHALEDAAVLLAQRDDLPAARAAYVEAVGQYTALRADWDLLRADSRLRRHGIRRGRRRRPHPAAGWDALTPTELKVAYLVADGLPNPDIAARLFLSRRTVEVHVSHALAKLGARSRVEIAQEAGAHRSAAGRPAARTADRPATRDASPG